MAMYTIAKGWDAGMRCVDLQSTYMFEQINWKEVLLG